MTKTNDGDLVKQKSNFPIVRFSNIISYKPDPRCYVVGNGFIRQGAGTLLQSFTGQGKSVMAQQWALHIATGKDIWGMPVKWPRKVLYLAGEGDEITWKRDFTSLNGQFKFNRKLVEKNFGLCHIFGYTDAEFSEAFGEKVDEFKPEVVVIDNYQSYVTGELNSSSCFREWVSLVDEIIKRRKIALLLLDHFPKPKDDEKLVDPRAGVYKGAGHSTKANWARASVELICPKPHENERRFFLNFSKCAERTGLTTDEGGPLRRLYVEWSHDANEPYWSLCKDQSAEVVTKGQYGPMIERMHEVHKDMTSYAMAKKLGCTSSTVSRYFKKMKWSVK